MAMCSEAAENVRSISPVFRPCRNEQTTPSPSPRKRSIDSDICFFCRRKGHWASSCPKKSKTISQSSPESAGSMIDGTDFPDLQCPCGAGTCRVWTSRTEKNPHRKFYRCPHRKFYRCPHRKFYRCSDSNAGGCKFFKWCDTVTSSWIHKFVVTPHPNCPCGAGKCIRLTEQSGRKFFACPVKKGHGACSFKQWHDLPRNGYDGDAVVRDIKMFDTISLSSDVEDWPSSSGPSEGKIVDGEASGCDIDKQSNSVEASNAALPQYNEQTESRYILQSSRPLEVDNPGRDARAVHSNVQSSSESSDCLAGPDVSPQVEGDDDYMSGMFLSTARRFANEFLKHIQGLNSPCFLRQRNQLVEAVRLVTRFGVDCSCFVSQIDNLIQMIDEFEALSALAEQESAIQQFKDQLSNIDYEDSCQQARCYEIKGQLDALVAEQAGVVQVSGPVTEGLRRLERQLLMTEMDVWEAEAVESQKLRADLQEKIARAEKEKAEIFNSLQMGCRNQDQLLEQLMKLLGSLQLWD